MFALITFVFLSIFVVKSCGFKMWRSSSIGENFQSSLHLIQQNNEVNSNNGKSLSASSKFLVAFVAIAMTYSFYVPMGVLAAQDVQNPRIYKSGKNPDGVSSKESTVGTKKDTSFLRCMSNCKTQCQLPGEGLVKSDCVQDCQDQCCNSYEQCSFKIKINTGNAI